MAEGIARAAAAVKKQPSLFLTTQHAGLFIATYTKKQRRWWVSMVACSIERSNEEIHKDGGLPCTKRQQGLGV
jgi:hypothetical protein